MSAAHLIFDFGGVVFDWNPQRLLARALPQRIATPEDAAYWCGQFFQGYTGEWSAFDRGLMGADELVARTAARTGLSGAEVQAVLEAVPEALAPLPDTVALLRDLRERGLRLFYLSNMPAPYAAHLKGTHGFLSLFENGVFSCDVQMEKPDPAIFKRALEQFEITARDSLFIDDYHLNVEAANRFGLTALLFTDARTLARDLRAHGVLPPV